MIESLSLVDRNSELVEAWRGAFAPFEEVKVREGDYFENAADLMVSPANSFGFMDGGLDLAIRSKLGAEVQTKLQQVIVSRFHGELAVGSCHIMETGHEQWPFLAATPTMRVPMDISGTLNVFYAFRALLLEVQRSPQRIRSVLCPGLGTGVGGMHPVKAAGQMAFAYAQFKGQPTLSSAREVLKEHARLAEHI